MDIITLLKDYRVAVNTRSVWECLKDETLRDEVYVRNAFFDELFPLVDFAEGPFTFTVVGEDGEINGIERETGLFASLRIVQSSKNPELGYVEIKNNNHRDWLRPGLGGVHIYIPA